MMTINEKAEETTDASPSVGLLLATVLTSARNAYFAIFFGWN